MFRRNGRQSVESIGKERQHGRQSLRRLRVFQFIIDAVGDGIKRPAQFDAFGIEGFKSIQAPPLFRDEADGIGNVHGRCVGDDPQAFDKDALMGLTALLLLQGTGHLDPLVVAGRNFVHSSSYLPAVRIKKGTSHDSQSFHATVPLV